MNIDIWLKEALEKIESMTAEEVVDKLEEHGLVDSYTIPLAPELIGLFDEEELTHLLVKLSEYAIEHNKVVIIGPTPHKGSSPCDFSSLNYRVIGSAYGNMAHYKESLDRLQQRAALLEQEPHTQINTNSRKKVVVSNSGFPYPVPQKSKKHK